LLYLNGRDGRGGRREGGKEAGIEGGRKGLREKGGRERSLKRTCMTEWDEWRRIQRREGGREGGRREGGRGGGTDLVGRARSDGDGASDEGVHVH
jgi:hypothetical protein